MKKVRFLIILIACLILPITVEAKENTIYLFYSETCPHCSAEREYLDSIKDEYPDMNIVEYEVINNKTNFKLMNNVKKTLEDYTSNVPYTVIGRDTLVGFNANTESSIVNLIEDCLENTCEDIVEQVDKAGTNIELEEEKKKDENTSFTVPILGDIDAKEISLPVLAAAIGLVDGFNPCAMWVLVFLISMLLGMKDRKRMWTIGLVFLTTSAFIYLLFMVAWLKISIEISSIVWVRILIAMVALIGAIVNIRSYLKERKQDAGCQVVNSKERKKIINRIKKFTSEKSFILAILGVIALAASVNFIELACSAGLPLLFTQILALNDLSTGMYALNIIIYILFYLFDDIIIFVIAMASLKITGITNKYNKYSHLIGGIIMLIIGLLMLFKPEILMLNI